MITNVFKKSTPINYILVAVLILFFYLMYQFRDNTYSLNPFSALEKTGIFIVIFTTFFFANFAIKKNNITKDSAFGILFYLLFLLFIPNFFNNYNLIFSNFFVVIALNKLFSIQNLKSVKEKIFDASMLVLVASLFQFWSILFLFVVYIAIIFHVSRDYRNWLIPFVAVFIVSILVCFYAVLHDKSFISTYFNGVVTNYNFLYFTKASQNVALSMFASCLVFFGFSIFFILFKAPLNQQANLKISVAVFFIGIVIYFLSNHKTNEILVFTVFPLAIMATNSIEVYDKKFDQELKLGGVILLALIAFSTQVF